jgi:hypothetical protein
MFTPAMFQSEFLPPPGDCPNVEADGCSYWCLHLCSRAGLVHGKCYWCTHESAYSEWLFQLLMGLIFSNSTLRCIIVTQISWCHPTVHKEITPSWLLMACTAFPVPPPRLSCVP